MLAELVAAGAFFACTPVAVWDGDGPIWCAEGPRVRLAGVAAREIDGTCRDNQPCPAMGGIEARDELVRLFGGSRGTLGTGHIKVAGPRLQCRSEGSAGGSRTAAWCRSAVTGDVACRLLAVGSVVRWHRYWRDHRC